MIDFGIARAAEATQLTGTGQIIGTLDFMAPEQIEGSAESGQPGDVFSFGCTLVHAATGRSPFAAEQAAGTVYKILHVAPDLRGVPPRIARIAEGGDRNRGRHRYDIGTRHPVTPAPTSVATAAAIDPNGPEARHVDRLCASGALLSALGDSATAPQPTGDPAVAKRDFLDAADRTIGTVAATLSDFTALRDDAPNDQVRTQFGMVVTEFTSAKAAFTDARVQVAASEPVTVAVYRKAIDQYLDGTRNLALAATFVKGIMLPPAYTDASAVAPRCKQ